MDKQIQQGVNYKKLYSDMIAYMYPNRLKEFQFILKKEKVNSFDIIIMQNKMLPQISKEQLEVNQRFRSYDEKTIKKILQFQKDNLLTNTQLASHFKLSRNTVAKWKKIFNK